MLIKKAKIVKFYFIKQNSTICYLQEMHFRYKDIGRLNKKSRQAKIYKY